ncbi:MAG TPA: YciI family protein [Pseudonocardiaceae bacterium]
MTKYMILIYGDAQEWDAMSTTQEQAHHAAHAAFRAKAGAQVIGGEELELSTMATTLRMATDDRVSTTDGPFLEAKEALGGYYLVEAADLDEVIALASLLPEVHAGHSGVEIRPVVDHG